jgi:hypothetical protein
MIQPYYDWRQKAWGEAYRDFFIERKLTSQDQI